MGKVALLVCVLLIGLIHEVLLAPSIDSSLTKSLKENGRVNVIVALKERTSTVLNQFTHKSFSTRAERINTVVNELKGFAARSQWNLLRVLRQESTTAQFTYTSLWTTNQIAIRGATLDLVEKLAAFDEVRSIIEEPVLTIDEPLDLTVYENLQSSGTEDDDEEIQWGIQKIEAPQVWATETTGENIVIATIDTGVRVTHEALRDNYRKDYGWYDPAMKTESPNDQNGHGTHTTGTIAGTAKNVGVAPGSQWIACKGCMSSSCFLIDLLECGDWVACPTDIQGNNPDCTKAPHVVSNSWGSARGTTWFSDSIKAWRAIGIIPLFSIGNAGPDCHTANSPGDDEDAIGVGSTTIENVLSSFSSVGPTYIGSRVKPDVAAPGSNVFSSYHTSDYAYASMSGTSMASPHAAGTVALMLAASRNSNTSSNYDLIKQALQGGAVPTTSEGKSCLGVPDTQVPNHHIGFGRINAKNSVVTFKQLLAAQSL